MSIKFEFEKLQSPLDSKNFILDGIIQSEWAHNLRREWVNINYYYLKDRLLKPPVFVFFDNKSEWGYWDSSKKVIGINIRLLCEYSWETVIYILKHEMAHQYANTVLFDKDETAHGPSFDDACRLLGIQSHGSCSFKEEAKEARIDDDLFRKIKKMLALASSSNEHEARSAMAMANKILLKYNIDKSALRQKSDYLYKYVDSTVFRVTLEKTIISNILQDFFFVKVLWCHSFDVVRLKKGSRLQISGTVENLEVAEYVYHFLVNQTDHLWAQYKKQKNIRLNKLKKSFAVGILSGFEEKLQAETKKNEEAGLIWLGDVNFDNEFKRLNPSIRSSKSGGGQMFTSALEDGKNVGRNLNLNMGIEKKNGFGGYLN